MKYVLVAHFGINTAMQYPLHDTQEQAESAARLTLQEFDGISHIDVLSCDVDPITGAPLYNSLTPINIIWR